MNRFSVFVGVALLSLSLLGSLILMSAAIQHSEMFGELYAVLLISNSAGLLALAILIGVNLWRLGKQLKKKEPGARLTRRLLVIFVVLSIVPVSILYAFSLDFLRRGIDSWFDVRIETALDDALALGQEALDVRMRSLLDETKNMAIELAGNLSASRAPLDLDSLRDPGSIVAYNARQPAALNLEPLLRRSGAEELTVVTASGELVAASSQLTDFDTHLPPENVLVQVNQGRNYIRLEPLSAEDLYVRVAVPIPSRGLRSGERILHALYRIDERMNELASSVEYAYIKYNELNYLRDKLKLSFVMTLTLVLLFSIVTAVWAALYSARRMAEPIRDLAAGTAAVAAGDYETKIPVVTDDDLGFLVHSFNDMTRQVGAAAREVEAQNKYVNTLLKQLSSGVIALDQDLGVTTINDAALRILEVSGAELLNRHFIDACEEREYLAPLAKAIRTNLQRNERQWRSEVTIFSSEGRRVLMTQGTSLSAADDESSGYVLVFEDVTLIVEGQREAAWSEVARRLAHEIKNPLTPIQLSAERLRRKYLNKLDAEESEPLERLTNTIIQQVDTMKSMVNTFSDYAKPARISHELVDINEVIVGVTDLFRSTAPLKIETELDPDLAPLPADANRLRQVLNNLIKNAIEASLDSGEPIVVQSCQTVSAQKPHIEIRISDRGEGIPSAMLDNLFEPYVTTKERGTGLGLAIAKKIVDEHHGVVNLKNRPGGGTEAIIRLPLDADPNIEAPSLERNIV
ncbi:MAG: ATP-binding protein [Pseudomonadota bacterium]